MASKKKITMSWSGGKDSAFALFKILASGEYEVVSLHTVIDKETRRVGLHGVREALIEQQAASIGIPLVKLYLTASQDHEAYASLMKAYYKIVSDDHVRGVAFGDIFLEDLKTFRQDLLSDSRLESYFPLWKIDSEILISDFIGAGFKTLICSADASIFSADQVGIGIDQQFIDALPEHVDPCGERGEFHSLVVDGPIFKKPLHVNRGEVVRKVYHFNATTEDGTVEKKESAFWFQDFLPETMS